ncbi:MAG: CSLREA domain-containing protein [Anaerolineales bacterium]
MKTPPKRLLYPLAVLVLGALLSSCGGGGPAPTPTPVGTLTVNSNNDADDGTCNAAHCSLREAINKAKTLPGTTTIKFNIGGGGPRIIKTLSTLPEVTVPVVIDGTSQPFFGSTPLIELDGSMVGGDSVDGLVLSGGDSAVKSLAVINFSGRGILITSLGNNTIEGCYIGINMYGVEAGNQAGGIVVASGNNTIGGTNFGVTRNVISGNHGDGVVLTGSLNSIEGNLIGLNAAGTAAIGNQGNGVLIDGNINMVGGNVPEARNIISGNVQNGIRIDSDSDEVQRNFIGTDISGMVAVGNQMSGIFVYGLGAVQIGGIDSGNIISANGLFGIWLDDSTNAASVFDNRVGTNKSGTSALGNIKGGIRVGGTNHQIGASGKGNLISGNGGAGIAVVAPATEIKIQNNFIGTSADGESAVGNDIGVEVGLTSGAYSVLIGGSLYGEGNLVSGNHGEGLLLYNNADVTGNRIGLDQSGLNELPNGGDGIRIKGTFNRIGTPHDPNSIAHNGGHGVAVITESGSAVNNTLSGNNIWDNGKLGIALGGDSVLANDPGDADTGDNNLQNYPVMVSAIHDPATAQTTVTATLDSAPETLFMVEFFVNTACDPTGYGEGEQMVADKTVTTNASGHGDITADFEPAHFLPGGYITATATSSGGDTSEFSNCIPVTQASAFTPTATSGGMQFKPGVSPMQFFFGGCTPDRAQISLEVLNPPEDINYMLLFVRLMDKKSGAAGAWSDGLSMSKLSSTKFLFDLTLDKLPDYEKYPDAWLQYQFVAYSKAQKEIGRSEVFWDVSFGRCGGAAITPTPTRPPSTHG